MDYWCGLAEPLASRIGLSAGLDNLRRARKSLILCPFPHKWTSALDEEGAKHHLRHVYLSNISYRLCRIFVEDEIATIPPT